VLFGLAQLTNRYKLRQAVNNRYGVSGRSGALYMEGGDAPVFNEALEEVLSDFPRFATSVVDLTLPVGSMELTKPQDAGMPRVFFVEWAACPSVPFMVGEPLEMVTPAEMQAEFPGWRGFTSPGSPTHLIVDPLRDKWFVFPAVPSAGHVITLAYQHKTKLFVGTDREAEIDNQDFIDVPDVYVGRLLGNKIAAKLAPMDLEYDRKKRFEDDYEIEKAKVQDEITALIDAFDRGKVRPMRSIRL